MPLRSVPHRWLTAAVLLGLLAPQATLAASRVSIAADAIEFPGGKATGFRASLELAPARVQVDVAMLQAPGLPEPLREVLVSCGSLQASPGRLRCPVAAITGRFGPLGSQRLTAALDWNTISGDARLQLANVSVAGGTMDGVLAGRIEAAMIGAWRLEARARNVDLARLAAMAKPWVDLPDGSTLAGAIDAEATIEGGGANPGRLEFATSGRAIGFANAAGTAAAEQLTPSIGLRAAQLPGGGWQFDASLRLPAGQVYFEPVFLDFSQHALELHAAGTAPASLATVEVTSIQAAHAGVLQARGTAALSPGAAVPLRRLRLQLDELDLATAIPAYVQPVLVGTSFKDLAGEGRLAGVIEVDDGMPTRLDLTLTDVTLDNPAGALGIDRLSGQVRWYDEDKRLELAATPQAQFASELHWQSGRLWGLLLGAAQVEFATTSRHFRLTRPATLPILDGGLAIDTLRVRHAGTPEMYVRLDASIKPISVAQIGRALGWPEFGGTLSGSIPRLTLDKGLVTLGGNIETRVFDGLVTVRNLRLRQPLGQFPQLFADVNIEALDLEQITSAFEFGRITGRLSGRIAGLETFAWQPQSFDAALYSTPGDRSPRRISQRAVANLSSIGGGSGGGVAAALQSGFLQFFEDFRYSRLGLSCRLRNDVCQMEGIAPAPSGYYIVQGSGIPRIDVIGNQRWVAWTRLVQQLLAVSGSAGPVVK